MRDSWTTSTLPDVLENGVLLLPGIESHVVGPYEVALTEVPDDGLTEFCQVENKTLVCETGLVKRYTMAFPGRPALSGELRYAEFENSLSIGVVDRSIPRAYDWYYDLEGTRWRVEHEVTFPPPPGE